MAKNARNPGVGNTLKSHYKVNDGKLGFIVEEAKWGQEGSKDPQGKERRLYGMAENLRL